MDFFIIVLIFVLAFFFINSFKSLIGIKETTTLKKIFIYHMSFGVYYFFFITGDAINYWGYPKIVNEKTILSFLNKDFQGTYFMYIFNYYPSNILDLSYFAGTMIYSVIGFIGLTYFYVIAFELVPKNTKFKGYYLFPLLFFLPNLHFWSCSVGKDTLLFFCIAIFTYGLLNPLNRIPMIILGLGLAYFIRPHITLFMLLGFGMAYFSGSNISVIRRVLFFGIMIGIAFTILPSVMKYAKIEEASLVSFNEFSDKKAALLSRAHTGSALDTSSYPFPLKIFTFLYRPFFFDINGFPSLLASIENLILLVLSISVLRNKPLRSFRSAPFVIQGLVYFLIIGTLAFSQSLGNVGIMIRMRNMFLPGLIIFIFWHFSFKQSEENRLNQ